MLKKTMMILIFVATTSVVFASDNCTGKDLWKEYTECAVRVERLADHGRDAITQEEKNATMQEIQDVLNKCALLSFGSSDNKKMVTETRLSNGDPATPGPDDEYEEVLRHSPGRTA